MLEDQLVNGTNQEVPSESTSLSNNQPFTQLEHKSTQDQETGVLSTHQQNLVSIPTEPPVSPNEPSEPAYTISQPDDERISSESDQQKGDDLVSSPVKLSSEGNNLPQTKQSEDIPSSPFPLEVEQQFRNIQEQLDAIVSQQKRTLGMVRQLTKDFQNVYSVEQQTFERLAMLQQTAESLISSQQRIGQLEEKLFSQQQQIAEAYTQSAASLQHLLTTSAQEFAVLKDYLQKQSDTLIHNTKEINAKISNMSYQQQTLNSLIQNIGNQNTQSSQHSEKGISAQILQPVLEALDQLQREFTEKIKYDENKERLIKDLRKMIDEYNGDIHWSLLKPLFQEFIALYNDMSHLIQEMRPYDHKTVANYVSFQETIEELLSRYEIESFSVNAKEYSAYEQKISSIIETSNSTLDKCIAERIAKGFRYQEHILQKEQVKVYTYKAPST